MRRSILGVVASMFVWGCGSEPAETPLDAVPPPPIDAPASDAQVCGTARAVGFALGVHHSCARLDDGTVRCWGGNFQGQLGDGDLQHQWCFDESEQPDCSLQPVAVSGLDGVLDLGSEFDHVCAARSGGGGGVACWGWNSIGQLGVEKSLAHHEPVAVAVASAVEARGGTEFSCARTGGGEVWCWGWNELGQLGDGTTTSRATPARVSGIADAQGLAVGGIHACALRAGGTVACWGLNAYGSVGDGTTDNRTTPVAVTGLTDVTAIAAGVLHTCALRGDGSVWCWGDNLASELGDDTTTARSVAAPVLDLDDAEALYAGGRAGCVRRAGGEIWCWGNNYDGQLAMPEAMRSLPRPTHIASLDGADVIGLAFQHGCAAFDDGVRCWGRGDFGVLGQGSEAWSRTPVPVCF